MSAGKRSDNASASSTIHAKEGPLHGLPQRPHSLVGREKDLEMSQSLILRGNVRLVTITGPPGVGKTRFAMELASTVASEFDHGLVFVDLAIKVLTEKKVAALPAGPLFWRVENFPTLAQAQAAAGAMGLAAESAGRAWLFTLGPAGGSLAGGTKVAEIGPLPPVVAPEYLLRINEPSGPPGSVTVVALPCPFSLFPTVDHAVL